MPTGTVLYVDMQYVVMGESFCLSQSTEFDTGVIRSEGVAIAIGKSVYWIVHDGVVIIRNVLCVKGVLFKKLIRSGWIYKER